MDSHQYLELSVELQNILINYADNWLGNSISMGIVGNDGQLFSTWPEGNTDYEQLDRILEQVQSDGSTYFTDIHTGFIRYSGEENYYTYVKALYDTYNLNTRLGILIVTVPLSAVENIVARSLEWEEHDVYIVNSENEILYTVSGEDGKRQRMSRH